MRPIGKDNVSYIKKNNYIYVFIGYSGSLLLCMGFPLVVTSKCYSFVVVQGLHTVVTSLAAERSRACRLQ